MYKLPPPKPKKKAKATSTPTTAIKIMDGILYSPRDVREVTKGMASARGGPAGEPGHRGMGAGPGDNLPSSYFGLSCSRSLRMTFIFFSVVFLPKSHLNTGSLGFWGMGGFWVAASRVSCRMPAR